MGASIASGRRGRFDLAQKADINVTPFVDVMLVLLIIFMVAAPLPTVWLNADLPAPSRRPLHLAPPPLVSIVRGGQITLNGQPVSLDQLPAAAARALGPDRATGRVMLRANRDVAYKDFMAVMNALERNGLTHIALVSEPA